MDPYEPVDDLSPTPEQEEARRRLWRRADGTARNAHRAGRPPYAGGFESPPPPRPSRPRPRRARTHRDPRLARRGPVVRAEEFFPEPFFPEPLYLEPPAPRSRGRGPLLLIALLAVAGAATCWAGMDRAAVMAEYGDPMAVSPEAAADVFARGANVLQELPDSGLLRVTLTDEEATSALALGFMLPELVRAMRSVSPDELRGTHGLDEIRRHLRTRILAGDARSVVPTTWLERVAAAVDPGLAVEDGQVRFSESGVVALAGSLRAWRLRQPLLVEVTPSVEGGRLGLDFHRVLLGRIPAPAGLFDRLGRLIPPERILGARYTDITELVVADGSLTIAGRIE